MSDGPVPAHEVPPQDSPPSERFRRALLDKEETLRLSEKLLGSIFRAAPIGIGLVSNRVLLAVNERICKMTGYTQEELVGRSARVLYPTDADFEYVGAEKYRQIRESGTGTVETRWQRKDGRIIDVLMSSTPIDPVDLSDGVTFTALDITERKKVEESLRRIEWMLSRDRTAGSVPNPPETVYAPACGDLLQFNTRRVILDAVGETTLKDITGDYLDLLDTATAVYEKNGDYALLLCSSSWCRFMHQASFRLCGTADSLQALRSGQWHCHESCWTQCAKDSIETGEPVDVECAGGLHFFAAPIRAGGEIVGAISVGYGDPPRDPAKLEELSEKFRVRIDELVEQARSYESRPPYIVELAKHRLRVSARLIGEIVERQRSREEREKLQAQLLQAQKMESVGRLAGGVAHDFNNMLGVILGHTELAMMKVDPEDPLYSDLSAVKKAAQRSADLTRQLLGFARKQNVAPRVLDLNDTVTAMLKMLRRLIGEDIDLAWMPAAGLWPTRIDPAQIDQILVNLVVNSRDAIAGVGRITIETGNVAIDEAYRAGHPEFLCGEYSVLAVSDDGCGMEKDVLGNLFEPFFTTKGIGQGTGLGLATVYGIVKQNDGFINVYSEPGKGATFRIYLPRFTGRIAATPTVSEEPMRPGSGETVLLVEDEESILSLGRTILQRLGYTVLTAGTPGEALRRAEEFQGEIHLLLTDLIMPEMNGRELEEHLRRIRPKIKCLFMSGYTANVIAHRGVLQAGVQFIQKPFTILEFSAKVREALARELVSG